jgi:hypothetical protein
MSTSNLFSKSSNYNAADVQVFVFDFLSGRCQLALAISSSNLPLLFTIHPSSNRLVSLSVHQEASAASAISISLCELVPSYYVEGAEFQWNQIHSIENFPPSLSFDNFMIMDQYMCLFDHGYDDIVLELDFCFVLRFEVSHLITCSFLRFLCCLQICSPVFVGMWQISSNIGIA